MDFALKLQKQLARWQAHAGNTISVVNAWVLVEWWWRWWLCARMEVVEVVEVARGPFSETDAHHMRLSRNGDTPIAGWSTRGNPMRMLWNGWFTGTSIIETPIYSTDWPGIAGLQRRVQCELDPLGSDLYFARRDPKAMAFQYGFRTFPYTDYPTADGFFAWFFGYTPIHIQYTPCNPPGLVFEASRQVSTTRRNFWEHFTRGGCLSKDGRGLVVATRWWHHLSCHKKNGRQTIW